MDSLESPTEVPFKILSLDGGGAKGFYTLGVLKELEATVGGPLCNHFGLVFGTSTGAIIAALLGLGRSIDDVHALYKEHVLTIMRQTTRRARTAALSSVADAVFGDHTFEDFRTVTGIVATRWDLERPMIFKSSPKLAHGRRATFSSGFGCSVADAIRASCSAYPIFDRVRLRKGDGATVEVVDGGYCANNPTLYAVADATTVLGHPHTAIRVVSVGVGAYPEPKRNPIYRVLKQLWVVQLLQKTLDTNTASMEQLHTVLFGDIPTVRINDTFERPELATDLLEHDLNKLSLLHQQGSESFPRHEVALRKLLST